jgi:hypothetical protein
MFAFSLAVTLTPAVTIDFGLDLKSYRQRVIGYDFPVAIGFWARFPYTAVKTEKITIMIIMVGKPNGYIYAPARIEYKLDSVYVHIFAPITMCRSVCGRTAFGYSRPMVNAMSRT